MRGGQADVDPARCISCGQCVTTCSQGAKRIRSSVEEVLALLSSGRRCVAMLAPSFPAAFIHLEPERLIGAMAASGFAAVHEVAFGADLVSREYHRCYAALTPDGPFLISTPCPAVVSFVEKIHPELAPYLAPVCSPMEAMGRVIRARDPGASVVFAGPCVGKKDEARRGRTVDAVLTFDELSRLFEARGVDPAAAPPREFDPPRAGLGRVYPVSGGLLKSASIDDDVLEAPVFVVEGSDRITEILDVISTRVTRGLDVRTRLFDLLFCEGCIAGPVMPNALSFYERKRYVVSYMRAHPAPAAPPDDPALRGIDLSASFTPATVSAPLVPEAEIMAVLAKTGKVRPEDELNCRACGYPSCRDKAIAVHRGIAEVEMCLPYLISKLEDAIRDLRDNQERLIQAEKLASMGQMAAGIAHEINNPLGVVLMYAHLLQDELGSGTTGRAREDADRIIREAMRTRSIVQGILNFAREEKVDRQPTDISALLAEAAAAARSLDPEGKVRVRTDFDAAMRRYAVDARQLRQVFDNLIRNAIEAMPDGGTLTLATRGADGEFTVTVEDSGHGIPPEILPKLFTPFLTTKPSGKGTGLGLPVCYGIVKMHGGTIQAANRPGGGARFEVTVTGAPGATGGAR